MSRRLLLAAVAVTLCAAWVGTAHARNPHCAGGIQYVVQGLRDKDKGNTEDYQREMLKAVDQLNQCATEDPADYEAAGYLGWAYADLDSAGPAGQWFATAAAAAGSKGDKKKLDAIITNRDHYWSIVFNAGIQNINEAGQLADAGSKDDAAKSYGKAIEKLTMAKLLRPGHPTTIRNLATAYALSGNFDAAETELRQGLVDAKADTASYVLNDALKTVRANKAGQLIDAKKYDEAIVYYNDLVKQDAQNADLWSGLGNALFQRAPTKQDAARKADFKLAGDAYSKAFSLRPSDGSLGFNAALGYQNAGEPGLAEAQWRAFLKVTPNDADALSSLGAVLADEKKFDEARASLEQAIQIKPDEKIYFRQLAAVYSKQGNNAKMSEMMFVYLPMQQGTPAADAAAAAKGAKPGSAAANTLAAMGTPEKVLEWTDNTAGKLSTWFYGAKKVAFTFNSAGVLVQKSDWNAKK